MEHTIEMISPKNLIAYKNNSRTHSKEQINQIENSIKEFGFTNPVLLDKNNEIIAGHGRVLASKKMGIKEVPCLRLSHLSEKQKKAYVIADNQLALYAGWDENILSLEIGDLSDNDFDISLLGFNDLELNGYLLKEFEGLTDEDEVPEPPVDPVTKLGNIWQLGNHRLMCEDTNNINSINKLLKNTIPNAIVTDPPYGIGIDGQKKRITNNPKHNRKYHEFRNWDNKRPEKDIFNYILSLNVPTVIWGGNYFADLLTPTRGWIYWSKGQDGLSMSDGELAWTTENKPLRSKTVNRNALKGSVHPTQKPVDIINFSINYLKVPEKGSVLDLFGGSGTTLICCEKSNKTSYLMELDPKYCDVIIKRWENFTGKKAELLNE